MRHPSFSQGAGRCCPVRSFPTKQHRAAVLSHQSHSTPEASEQWNTWKAGAGAQEESPSWASSFSLVGGWCTCPAACGEGREQEGPARTFGSRRPQRLIFHHPGGFSMCLCKYFVNLPAHYSSIVRVYSFTYFIGCTDQRHRRSTLTLASTPTSFQWKHNFCVLFSGAYTFFDS